MTTKYTKLFDEALALEKSEHLLEELVETMKADDLSQLEVYVLFEHRMLLEQEAEQEDKKDQLADIMALIWGWCPASARLFPQNLTNGEVAAYWKQQRNS